MESIIVYANYIALHHHHHYSAFVAGIVPNKVYQLVEDRNEKGQIVIKNKKGKKFTLESTIKVDDWENEDIPATVSL